MRAINLPHFKSKLKDVSRELFLEHGWDMPRGLQDWSLRDPENFTREEWQQAKRAGVDPREIKAVVKQSWVASDSRASFESALNERGFWLARGDRRGYVALDYRGEVYSLSRYAGVKTNEVEARLGDRSALPSVDDVKAEISRRLSPRLEGFIKEVEAEAKQRMAMLDFRKGELLARHKEERSRLWDAHEKRWLAETNQRARQLPRGFSGIWHRLTGQYRQIREKNERATIESWQRDRAEKDALIFKQLEERETLQHDIKRHRARSSETLMQLRADIANFSATERDQELQRRREKEEERRRNRSRRPSGP